MPDPIWTFEEYNPRSVRRDPFEAEFFTGEEESEEVYGRTDSLVREAIQNSLDARIDQRPALVRFCLSTSEDELSSASAARYLKGLPEHMRVLGNEVLSGDPPFPPMSWLVVEDFHTRGLTGDPSRVTDPTDKPELESFYWFWRNIGRSGKSGTDRGRWGLGKTVFPATSRINALFGLTIRHDDDRRLLLGQAVTKSHEVGNKSYEPEAFFHASSSSDLVQMPCEDRGWIERFCSDFKLQRGDRSGLSIVAPYPFARLKAKEIVRSVIVHYFLAILRNELEVTVEGPDCSPTHISSKSIQSIAASLEWDGRRQEKKHSMPPFDFARWAISQQATGLNELSRAGLERVPEWKDSLFPEGMQERLRSVLQGGGRVALRVPMTVEMKNGELKNCFFDVFIERDANLDRSEDYFVREGMTIAGIATLGSSSGYRGLVMVDHDVLSNLLGDSEGPAHNDWLTGEARPDRAYAKWKRRVSFVKASLHKLIGFLTPPPAGLDRDLLRDLFWVDGESLDENSGQGGQRTRRGTERPPVVPPLPPPAPKPYKIEQLAGGFRVTQGIGDAPGALSIRIAYDIPDGNPLKNWSALDFDLREGQVHLETLGAEAEVLDGNKVQLVPTSNDFELRATGFDTTRDLYVDARVLPNADEGQA